jgi:hypothetical protein
MRCTVPVPRPRSLAVADAETVRAVAEKISQIVAESVPKKASGAAKKKAA